MTFTAGHGRAACDGAEELESAQANSDDPIHAADHSEFPSEFSQRHHSRDTAGRANHLVRIASTEVARF